MTRPHPYDEAAHVALLNAAFEATPFDQASLDSAEASLREAIAISSDYARAHGELAYTLTTKAVSGWYDDSAAQDFLAEARNLADRALEIDPHDYLSHWNKAHVLVNTGSAQEFDEGIAVFERAVELFNSRTDPMERKPGLLAEFGEVLVHGGRVEEGIELIRKALKTPDWYRWSLAFALYCHRDYDGAVAALDDMSAGQEDARFLYATLLVRGAAEAQRGQKEAADAAVEAFFRLAPSHEVARHIVAQEVADNGFRGFAEQYAGDATTLDLVQHWNEGLEKAGFTQYEP